MKRLMQGSRILRSLAGVVLAAALAVGFAGTAHAATADVDFAGQARAAGLTAAQASDMQRLMDTYVMQTGGVQVAVNRIDVPGVGGLVVAFPGEKYARDPGSALGPVAPLTAPPCYAGDLCLYSGQNYTGSYLYYYKCQTIFMPWSSTGSFNDNQTTGTRSVFERISPRGNLYYYAKVKVSSINWANIGNITVC